MYLNTEELVFSKHTIIKTTDLEANLTEFWRDVKFGDRLSKVEEHEMRSSAPTILRNIKQEPLAKTRSRRNRPMKKENSRMSDSEFDEFKLEIESFCKLSNEEEVSLFTDRDYEEDLDLQRVVIRFE